MFDSCTSSVFRNSSRDAKSDVLIGQHWNNAHLFAILGLFLNSHHTNKVFIIIIIIIIVVVVVVVLIEFKLW